MELTDAQQAESISARKGCHRNQSLAHKVSLKGVGQRGSSDAGALHNINKRLKFFTIATRQKRWFQKFIVKEGCICIVRRHGCQSQTHQCWWGSRRPWAMMGGHCRLG